MLFKLLLWTLQQSLSMLLNGPDSPNDCLFPWVDLALHLIHGSLSPPEPKNGT